MKLVKSKKEQRRELEAQIRAFQARGGTVSEVPRGQSGRDTVNSPLPHVFDKKAEPETRTPVSDEIAAIEERKKPQTSTKQSRPKQSRPRKKLIYDEFGEPLRWEWVE
ncbi:hypothetical protein KO507_04450 [Gilvimarinus agarilyticus]|uniref:hypothetical protein n=1 Tax=unclassified Gilvimarinus TaxID=2642066 RepID=UPI001C0A3A07|nr:MULTISPECIES: hypothetical protein [unclassified Gilvimarinus]MBU2885016.1 hypothetical protein [Gilvimarinus agarilyticus]MDO6569913.1 hypothetical protein [Gilvimarinus sp. 2_MG-2023]MDO6747122.1 hypothetical protein [Gilvimarinus sp. 1_MG-2023]